MNVILHWLAQQAWPFYLVSLLGAAAYVAVAFAARRKQRAAQFSLEREINHQQMLRAWVMAGLFLLLGVFVFVITAYFVPALPPLATETPVAGVGLTAVPTVTATPTATPMLLPTMESASLLGTPTPEQGEPSPTPTLTPTPLATAAPPDCPSPDVQITAPLAGGSLSGVVEVRGTAQVNSFAYYKFEVQFPESDSPNFISQFEAPVEGGILGYWDISDLALYPPGGPYSFRLVAVDIYGNTTSCTIPVYIAQ